jgi:Flp pilus assembly pilin Flp
MVPAMTRVLTLIISFATDTEGQDLLEYALLMALIAVGAILTVTGLGATINSIFWAPIAANI